MATHLEQLKRDIADYISGDDAAGDRVCASLDTSVREAVYGFLPPQDAEREDVVQDALLAMLEYLRRARDCPDNPEAFVVTVALNRCRNLYHWRKRRSSIDIQDVAATLPSRAEGPLELLDAREVRDLLAEAFAALDPPCRRLLKAVYLEERSIEELRSEAGLSSVQGIYHRKNVCFRKVTQFFNRSLLSGRYTGRTDHPRPRSTEEEDHE